MKKIEVGDRVEGRPVGGAVRHGTVLAVAEGEDYGQRGKVARVKWDGIWAHKQLPVYTSWERLADLRKLETAREILGEQASNTAVGILGALLPVQAAKAAAGVRKTKWEQTPAGFRGASEDLYSAAVATLAAVLAGQDKVQTAAPGWIVKGELFGPEVRITAVPTDDEAGRSAVQGMKRFRGSAR